ncbi:MAG: ABC transporter ATP-binding protein [Candidatus Omnitrophica bacterium]|nr:ABC transporter ATP-binding protein [Candidatus Omnitrophota bacterium]
MNPLLDIKNLSVTVGCQADAKSILDNVSFSVGKGRIMALVGPSGSGKTTAGMAILRLLDQALIVRSGEVLFENEDILAVPAQRMRRVRGAQIAMVFQEPLDAFDPLFTIGQQIDEVLAAHTDLSSQERHERVLEVLSQVQLPQPGRVVRRYPHQLSGGQRQRVLIAQSIACRPKLLIADEPTSNLDVVAQAGIMDVLRALKNRAGVSIILITHDLGMVAHIADDAVVLCEGRVVEAGPIGDLMTNPRHPYTQAMVEVFR